MESRRTPRRSRDWQRGVRSSAWNAGDTVAGRYRLPPWLPRFLISQITLLPRSIYGVMKEQNGAAMHNFFTIEVEAEMLRQERERAAATDAAGRAGVLIQAKLGLAFTNFAVTENVRALARQSHQLTRSGTAPCPAAGRVLIKIQRSTDLHDEERSRDPVAHGANPDQRGGPSPALWEPTRSARSATS